LPQEKIQLILTSAAITKAPLPYCSSEALQFSNLVEQVADKIHSTQPTHYSKYCIAKAALARALKT
jgi:hypothetical protein